MAGPKKGAALRIEGLKQLQSELKRLDEPTLLEELKDANKEVGDRVVEAAQSRADGRLQVAAAASLRSSRQAARAQVVGGSAAVPFFGGAEFGSQSNQVRIHPGGGTYLGHNQFEPFRGSDGDAGYFLYPAIREITPEIIDTYGDALAKIAAKAFPD